MTEAQRLLDAVWSSWRGVRDAIEAAVGVEVWLVGGYLRDLMLGREPTDIDLVVEGDVPEFAEELARAVGGTVRSTPRFLTASVELPDGQRIDVARARSESYRAPGSLPHVRPATIAADLERRDFTVNTFALGLAGGTAGTLIASEEGRADLRDRRLRVLHERSFLDDPTRVLRAVRLELELGFRLAGSSEKLAREALLAGALAPVSGERLWNDLRPLLRDASVVVVACRRLEQLGALAALVDGLGWSTRQERLLSGSLEESRLLSGGRDDPPPQGISLLALLVLASGETDYRGAELADRLKLSRRPREVLRRWPRQLEAARLALDAPAPLASSVHTALQTLSTLELAFLASHAGPAAGRWVRRELFELRSLQLGIGARELLDAGCASGAAVGRALDRTLAARLDGEIGPEQELDYALGTLGGVAPEATGADESE